MSGVTALLKALEDARAAEAEGLERVESAVKAAAACGVHPAVIAPRVNRSQSTIKKWIKRWKRCAACGGWGTNCSVCHGTGEVPLTPPEAHALPQQKAR